MLPGGFAFWPLPLNQRPLRGRGPPLSLGYTEEFLTPPLPLRVSPRDQRCVRGPSCVPLARESVASVPVSARRLTDAKPARSPGDCALPRAAPARRRALRLRARTSGLVSRRVVRPPASLRAPSSALPVRTPRAVCRTRCRVAWRGARGRIASGRRRSCAPAASPLLTLTTADFDLASHFAHTRLPRAQAAEAQAQHPGRSSHVRASSSLASSPYPRCAHRHPITTSRQTDCLPRAHEGARLFLPRVEG